MQIRIKSVGNSWKVRRLNGALLPACYHEYQFFSHHPQVEYKYDNLFAMFLVKGTLSAINRYIATWIVSPKTVSNNSVYASLVMTIYFSFWRKVKNCYKLCETTHASAKRFEDARRFTTSRTYQSPDCHIRISFLIYMTSFQFIPHARELLVLIKAGGGVLFVGRSVPFGWPEERG